ncbi:MAG: D-alanine--D-alanine ligase [Maricaulaceae bacterium]|jgi:D-alanine-D-alanine ligase
MSKRIAVLLGGLSAEREVSLASGAGCAAALTRKGYEVIEVDPQDPNWIPALAGLAPDAVFNALHGKWGEDGCVQGVLEYLQLPYTHSGVAASALAMDKTKTKIVLGASGIDAPRGRLIPVEEVAQGLVMDPPYVIKPNAEGSSVGVFFVRPGDNRPPESFVQTLGAEGGTVLVEEFISGRELTTTVLGDRTLGVTEIETEREFYDYEAKYAPGGSRHTVPADIPDELAARCEDIALKAHEIVGCRGLTRSDFRYDPATDRLAFIEINTQPGMTPTSLAPEQAEHAGMSFGDLVDWMVKDASCPR